MIYEKLYTLFLKYYTKTATLQEENEFFELLQHQKDNQALEDVLNKFYLASFDQQNNDLVDFEKNKILNDIFSYTEKSTTKRFFNKKWLIYSGVAAALLILVVLFFSINNNEVVEKQIVSSILNDVAPGGNKAVLTLGNGDEILLDTFSVGRTILDGNLRITKLSNGQISYQVESTASLASTYNHIRTPFGGNYQVVLPDGSKVWLNASTHLKYPLNFGNDERRIELNGEAYFEIAKNASKPFYVDLANGKEIKVLGTHFNVNTFGHDNQVTTVIEGVVQVSSNSKKEIVRENQQLIVNHDQLKLFRENVNIEEVLAWKEGFFSIHAISLYTLMVEVQRWYGVQVDLTDVNDIDFVIRLRKDISLSQLIALLELTKEVKFELHDKTIKVMNIDKR